MTINPLQNNAKALDATAECARNEAGRNGAGNTETALEHSEPDTEVRHMSHYGHYGDSTPADNTEQSGNWKSIGELARRLVENAK